MGDDRFKVWVGGLPSGFTHDEIKSLFLAVGQPTNVEMLGGNQACVQYSSEGEVNLCIPLLNGFDVSGTVLKCEKWIDKMGGSLNASMPKSAPSASGGLNASTAKSAPPVFSGSGAAQSSMPGMGVDLTGGFNNQYNMGPDMQTMLAQMASAMGMGGKGMGASPNAAMGANPNMVKGANLGKNSIALGVPPPAPCPPAASTGSWQAKKPKEDEEAEEWKPEEIMSFWITVIPPSVLSQGFPGWAPALIYQKGDNQFSNAAHILTHLNGNSGKEVEIIHDQDWDVFPELAEACKQATGFEYATAIAMSKKFNMLGIGLSGSKKGREAAAKLAVSIAISIDNPTLMAQVEEYYPGFTKIAVSRGKPNTSWAKKRKQGEWIDALPSSGKAAPPSAPKASYQSYPTYQPPSASQKQTLAIMPPAPLAPVPQAAAPSAQASQPSAPSGQPPRLQAITLAPGARLLQQGLPQTAPVLLWNKACSSFYNKADRILHDLVQNMDMVALQDDPDWEIMPEVGQAMRAAKIEDNSYCVAVCTTPYCWAVGLAGGYKGREPAAKMALSIALMSALKKTEEFMVKYPEVATIISGAAKG